MRHVHGVREGAGESAAIGWISFTEVFLLGVVVLLSSGLMLQTRVDRDVEALKQAEARAEALKADAARAAQAEKDAAAARRDAEERERLRRSALEEAARARTERDKTRAALAAALAEAGRLRADLASKVKSYDELYQQFRDAADRVLRPLEGAELVIKVRCEKLPSGFDLDLYVQDPEDRLCYWKQPRVLTSDAETGMLIPSEDLRFQGSHSEEIFTSVVLQETPRARPYLVFAMLRGSGKDAAFAPAEILWEVHVRRGGKLDVADRGKRVVRDPGRVYASKGNYTYQGITPVLAFEVDGPVTRRAVTTTYDMPGLPRGWGRAPIPEGSRDFNRIRDAAAPASAAAP